jgi:hypothetical protein
MFLTPFVRILLRQTTFQNWLLGEKRKLDPDTCACKGKWEVYTNVNHQPKMCIRSSKAPKEPDGRLAA